MLQHPRLKFILVQELDKFAIKVGNVDTGQTWRMGTFRLDIHPGGRSKMKNFYASYVYPIF